MRLWRRARHTVTGGDELDPEVARVFTSSTARPRLDPQHLVRARVRIDALLHELPPRGGLLRRIGLASLGGGGMWAGLISAAAANKAAAAAVGLSVLLGGTVVETTGVGPAVRDAVAHAVTQSQSGDENVDPTATATAAVNSLDASNDAAVVKNDGALPELTGR
jgi:hypothetical protein